MHPDRDLAGRDSTPACLDPWTLCGQGFGSSVRHQCGLSDEPVIVGSLHFRLQLKPRI